MLTSLPENQDESKDGKNGSSRRQLFLFLDRALHGLNYFHDLQRNKITAL